MKCAEIWKICFVDHSNNLQWAAESICTPIICNRYYLQEKRCEGCPYKGTDYKWLRYLW